MKQTERKHWVAYAATALALGLMGSACSSDAPSGSSEIKSSEMQQALSALQTLDLVAGADAQIDLGSSALQVVDNDNTEALEIVRQGNTLRLRGLRYGVSTISLREAGAEPIKVHILVDGTRPSLPIERFAPYNVDASGQALASSHKTSATGLFGYQAAKHLQLTHEGKVYRTPSHLEQGILFPYERGIAYSKANQISYEEELIDADGEGKWYAESVYSPGRGVAYAIRFAKPRKEGQKQEPHTQDFYPYATDNKLRTAYRYEYGPNPDEEGSYRIQITARYLGESFNGGLPVVANEGFWQSGKKGDVTLVLPTYGKQIQSDTRLELGFVTGGEYHSRDLSGAIWGSSWAMHFHGSGATRTMHADTMTLRPIRPIASVQ